MKIPHFNITIVGSGITGLSTAYHLDKSRTEKVALVAGPDISTTSSSAGILVGALNDNFTRLSNAHGLDFAKELWEFTNKAFDKTIAFCKEHKIPHKKNRRIRLIVSKEELKEAEIAVKQMQSVGLEGTLYKPDDFPYLDGFRGRVLAVQDDGERAAWVQTKSFTKALRAHSSLFEIPKTLVSFEKSKEGLLLNFDDGSEITTEFIVLACHTQIAHFLPSIKEALVTYADQWSTVDLPHLESHHEGLVFSAHHGYEWGLILHKSLHFGGARYLREMAGIGASQSSVLHKVTAHLKTQLEKTFEWARESTFTHSTGLLDVWPCDELPVIGPMFGEDRVLVATGYMGTGLGLGFFAGLCLSDLIRTGKSSHLPRRLWPERLRTL